MVSIVRFEGRSDLIDLNSLADEEVIVRLHDSFGAILVN